MVALPGGTNAAETRFVPRRSIPSPRERRMPGCYVSSGTITQIYSLFIVIATRLSRRNVRGQSRVGAASGERPINDVQVSLLLRGWRRQGRRYRAAGSGE